MQIKKYVFGLVALLGFGLMISQSAFVKAKTRITMVAYQYNLSTPEGILTDTNWTPVSFEETPTECELTGDLPCIIQFDAEEYSSLSDFLLSHSDADDLNNDTAHTKRHKDADVN